MAEKLISASGHVTETTRECYSAKSRLQSARTWWTCLESQSDRHHREAERPTAGNNGLRRTSRNILPKIALLMHRLHSSTSRRNWTSGRGRYEQRLRSMRPPAPRSVEQLLGPRSNTRQSNQCRQSGTLGHILFGACSSSISIANAGQYLSWAYIVRIVSPVPRCKRWPPVPQCLATCRTNMITLL